MKMKIIIFTILLSYLSIAFASQATLQFDDGLGEKSFDLYSGPRDPLLDFDRSQGKLSFQDERIDNSYFLPLVEPSIKNLNNFWYNDLQVNAACPQEVFEKNYNYIRYLFRLMAMSYNFEILNSLDELRFNTSGKSGACQITWEKIYGKCKPRSTEMGLFLKRVRYFIDEKFKKGKRKLKDRVEMRQIVNLYFKNEGLQKSSLGAHALYDFAQLNGYLVNSKNFTSNIDKACSHLIKMSSNFCSERDDFFAGRNMPFLENLVLSSNATNALKESSIAKGCVRRFVRSSSFKARRYVFLENNFPAVYQLLRMQKEKYVQGRIFLPGALKEFDDLGLKDFLYVKKVVPKPTPKPKVVVVKKVVKPKPLPKVVKIKATPKPVVVKAKPTPKPIWEDHFYQAIKHLRKDKKRMSVIVDLEGLVKDYPFTPKMIKRIATPLSVYQRVKSLRQMKKYDKIGSKKAPVILSFLLYMISHGQHQGLYNVGMVLGNEFYVTNNFDKKHSHAILVSLLNDETTGYQWQLKVLKRKRKNKKKP